VTLAAALAPLLARPWLLVGVGSELRGDDAFGPLLARRLAAEGMPALDGGTAPESLTGPIVRSGAEVLLLADIGRLGEPPGTLRLLAADALAPAGSSTHDPALGVLIAYLVARRPMTVHILVVEPARTGLGSPISAEVGAALDRAVHDFLEAASEQPGPARRGTGPPDREAG